LGGVIRHDRWRRWQAFSEDGKRLLKIEDGWITMGEDG
jgi:hypothetical protein